MGTPVTTSCANALPIGCFAVTESVITKSLLEFVELETLPESTPTSSRVKYPLLAEATFLPTGIEVLVRSDVSNAGALLPGYPLVENHGGVDNQVLYWATDDENAIVDIEFEVESSGTLNAFSQPVLEFHDLEGDLGDLPAWQETVEFVGLLEAELVVEALGSGVVQSGNTFLGTTVSVDGTSDAGSFRVRILKSNFVPK